METTFTKDGYPTDATLDAIKNFEGTPHGFVDFIKDRCWNDTYGHDIRVDLTEGEFNESEHEYRVFVSTGGWSGNEDIIHAMEKTMFWMIFWDISRRGGHYVFVIRESMWDAEVIKPIYGRRRKHD